MNVGIAAASPPSVADDNRNDSFKSLS